MKKTLKRCLLFLLTMTMILPVLPAMADAPAGSLPPASVQSFLEASDRWQDWTLVSWVNPDDADINLFVSLRKGNSNDLLCFKPRSGEWVYAWHNAKALPQGDFDVHLATITGATHLETDRLITAPAFQSWYVLNDELMDKSCIWEYDGSTWQLTSASFFEPMRSVVVRPNKLTYYQDEGARVTSVRGRQQTNLRYFSMHAFPDTLEEARALLSNPPAIPAGQLSAKEVKFTGGKRYKVYQGPGEEYGQAGNGKAIVSTNDWIQVFGRMDDWVLIQYDVTSEKMRIGWMEASVLPRNADVPELTFAPTPAVLAASAALTDDPLFSQSAITTLPQGTEVTWLASMGAWAYVAIETDTVMLYGFVPSRAVSVAPPEQLG